MPVRCILIVAVALIVESGGPELAHQAPDGVRDAEIIGVVPGCGSCPADPHDRVQARAGREISAVRRRERRQGARDKPSNYSRVDRR